MAEAGFVEVDRAYDWVAANRETVLRIVQDRAPSWSPRFIDGLVADRVDDRVRERIGVRYPHDARLGAVRPGR